MLIFPVLSAGGVGIHQDVTVSTITELNILDSARIQELAALVCSESLSICTFSIFPSKIVSLFPTLKVAHIFWCALFSNYETWLNCHGLSYSRVFWLADVCCLLFYQRRKLQRKGKGMRPNPAHLMEGPGLSLLYYIFIKSISMHFCPQAVPYIIFSTHQCKAGYAYRE